MRIIKENISCDSSKQSHWFSTKKVYDVIPLNYLMTAYFHLNWYVTKSILNEIFCHRKHAAVLYVRESWGKFFLLKMENWDGNWFKIWKKNSLRAWQTMKMSIVTVYWECEASWHCFWWFIEIPNNIITQNALKCLLYLKIIKCGRFDTNLSDFFRVHFYFRSQDTNVCWHMNDNKQ